MDFIEALSIALVVLGPGWLLLLDCVRSAARGWAGWDWRPGVLAATTLWGAALVAVTEGLSSVRALDVGPLCLAWAAVTLVALLLARSIRRRFHASAGSRGVQDGAAHWFRTRGLHDRAMLVTAALQVAALFVVAAGYPPNTVDSINYHMPRVMHWQQQHSVDFYASSVMMQNRGAPFAEYVIAHLQILTDGDRLANLVQWSAMLFSAVGVSWIVRLLGGRRSAEIAAAVLSVSLPMGIMQATSTQNDYVAAATSTTFVAFLLYLLRHQTSTPLVALTGLALGLAMLTKLTVLAYLPAFCAVAGLCLVLRRGWRGLATGVVLAGLAVALNAGFMHRMIELYGTPTGPSTGLANVRVGLYPTLSNIIRSLAVNVPVPLEVWPVPQFAGAALGGMRSLHEVLGLDPLDPATSLVAVDAFLTSATLHEDTTGNPVHLLLVMLALAVMWRVSVPTGGERWTSFPFGPRTYAGCLIVGFVFFSAYFKWQPWITRLQLPLFVLATPLIAVTLFDAGRRWRYWVVVAVGVVGFRWTVGNVTRPLDLDLLRGAATRNALYFTNRPNLFPVHASVVEAVRRSGCNRLGLHIGSAPFEYPIWVLLGERRHDVTIRHVNVPSETGRYADSSFQPCAIITTGDRPAWKDTPFELPARFRNEWVLRTFDNYQVLLDPGAP